MTDHQLARDLAANVAWPDERHGVNGGRYWPATVVVGGAGADTRVDMSWNDGTGLCAGMDPDLWFPENSATATGTTAKRVCLQCPLLEPCREHGIRHERHGIWGGLSERDRRQVRRERGGMRPVREVPTTVVNVRARVVQRSECGTYGGADRHRRMGTPVCDDCKRAVAAYMADYRRRKREA